jgi:invasion protein IalB
MRLIFAALLAAALTAPFSVSAQKAAAPAAPTAPAEPKVDITRNGDWEVACQDVDQNGNKFKACEMRQILVQKETQKEWLRIAVSYNQSEKTPDGGKKPILRIFTPLGVLLPPGMEIKIDDTEPMRVQYAVCLSRPPRCLVAGPMDDKLVALLKRGASGTVTFVLPNGKKVAAPFSLNGFTKSFNALPQ